MPQTLANAYNNVLFGWTGDFRTHMCEGCKRWGHDRQQALM